MIITKDTKVLDLIESEPFMLEALVAMNPGFDKLRNPLFRNTMGRMASLEMAAGFMGQNVDELMKLVRQAILKDIIQDLHDGIPLDRAKERFSDLVANVDAAEIGAMEQALMKGGMPAEEIKRLCNVHVQVFQSALDEAPIPKVDAGHPLAIFFEENRAIEELCRRMDDTVAMMVAPACPSVNGGAVGSAGDCTTCGTAPEDEEYLIDQERFRFLNKDLLRLVEWFAKVDHHYQRKENQLFPVLESRGLTGPSQVMWGVDDDIRADIKALRGAVEAQDAPAFATVLPRLMKALPDMIYKEERILFPLCLEHFDQGDWERVRSGEAGLGYGLAGPGGARYGASHAAGERQGLEGAGGAAARPEGGSPESRIDPAPVAAAAGGRLELSTGSLSLEEARAVFTHLPVDISFVNQDDEVVFYSDNPERIFPRTPSVIGRKVQFCHPPKSMHIVQRILDDFRSGTRKHAEFWINLGGRFIYIQYFAVRNESGAYLGCMEVSQDLTRLRALEGEKRLLD